MNGVETVLDDDEKIYIVHSLEEYIKILNELLTDESSVVFRGHSDKDWKLLSSGDRNKFNNQNYHEIWLECYKHNYDIVHKGDFLNNVVTMQHYMLPTKLLDWSYNPLIALYFAVEKNSNSDKDGEVILAHPRKIYEPDTDEIEALSTYLDKVYHNKNNLNEKIKLFHLLNCNKYMFFCVAQSNDRIQAQAGLFSITLDISDESIVRETEQEIERIVAGKRDNNKGMDAYENIREDYKNHLGIKRITTEFFRDIEKNKDSFRNEKRYSGICDVLPQIERTWIWEYYRLPYTNIEANTEKIRVPSKCKAKIRDNLKRFCNIHARTIYPDFPGYTEFIRKFYLDENKCKHYKR